MVEYDNKGRIKLYDNGITCVGIINYDTDYAYISSYFKRYTVITIAEAIEEIKKLNKDIKIKI